MFVTNKQTKKQQTQPVTIKIDGHTFQPKNDTKVLGITIQSNLSFDQHILELINRIRKAVGRIRSFSFMTPFNRKESKIASGFNGEVNDTNEVSSKPSPNVNVSELIFPNETCFSVSDENEAIGTTSPKSSAEKAKFKRLFKFKCDYCGFCGNYREIVTEQCDEHKIS